MTDMTLRITGPNSDNEYWLHLNLPDGKHVGLNLGTPMGMICAAALMAACGKTFIELKVEP